MCPKRRQPRCIVRNGFDIVRREVIQHVDDGRLQCVSFRRGMALRKSADPNQQVVILLSPDGGNDIVPIAFPIFTVAYRARLRV